MSSTKVYRMNVKVVIPAPKAVELLAEVKAKKGVADLEEYFTKHFGKVMDVAAKQIVKTTNTTNPFSYKLFASGWSKEDAKEYFYNFGIQGVYTELVAFMENSYVHTVLRFISRYSKKMMYKPHGVDGWTKSNSGSGEQSYEKREPYGDYYIHIGDGPYHFNLPNVKPLEPGAKVVATKTTGGASKESTYKSSGSASVPNRKGPTPPPSAPSAPPCELEVVSCSLAEKMRKIKEVEAEYEAAVKRVEELKEWVKELAEKKVAMKGDVKKLTKRLNELIDKDADECETHTPAEKLDSESESESE